MTSRTKARTGRPNRPKVRAMPLPGSWLDSAACVGMPASIFFPEGERLTEAQVSHARQVCRVCAVKDECLDYALRCEEIDPVPPQGIWAGLTPGERLRLRRDAS